MQAPLYLPGQAGVDLPDGFAGQAPFLAAFGFEHYWGGHDVGAGARTSADADDGPLEQMPLPRSIAPAATSSTDHSLPLPGSQYLVRRPHESDDDDFDPANQDRKPARAGRKPGVRKGSDPAGQDKAGDEPWMADEVPLTERAPRGSATKERRRQQNRIAQRALRERKESHVRALETRAEDQDRELEQLRAENDQLRAAQVELQARLDALQPRSCVGMPPWAKLSTASAPAPVADALEQGAHAAVGRKTSASSMSSAGAGSQHHGGAFGQPPHLSVLTAASAPVVGPNGRSPSTASSQVVATPPESPLDMDTLTTASFVPPPSSAFEHHLGLDNIGVAGGPQFAKAPLDVNAWFN